GNDGRAHRPPRRRRRPDEHPERGEGLHEGRVRPRRAGQRRGGGPLGARARSVHVSGGQTAICPYRSASTTVCVLFLDFSLSLAFCRWAWTVRREMSRSAAIWFAVLPAAERATTLRSRAERSPGRSPLSTPRSNSRRNASTAKISAARTRSVSTARLRPAAITTAW